MMKKIKTLVSCVLLIDATTACEKDSQKDCQETASNSFCCRGYYVPVCGCNNKTYSNGCEAENVGIMNYTKGACK